jgi:hypothetical protein
LLKTAICTRFGLFEIRRMPFGLRNAGNTFPRMMDRILAGLSLVFGYQTSSPAETSGSIWSI